MGDFLFLPKLVPVVTSENRDQYSFKEIPRFSSI